MPNANSHKEANGTAGQHYSGVLKDLATKLEYHERECKHIRSLMEGLTDYQPPAVQAPAGHESLVGKGEGDGSKREFEGLSVIGAAARYLEQTGSPQPARAIKKALLEGGFKTKSKDFSAILWPALSRHVKRTTGTSRSVITKAGEEFGLTKWKKEGVML